MNAVLPSIMDMPTNRAEMPEADPDQRMWPATVADLILFLASPSARAVNGVLLPVTKGR